VVRVEVCSVLVEVVVEVVAGVVGVERPTSEPQVRWCGCVLRIVLDSTYACCAGEGLD
jgi:hypothetical protein